MPEREYRSAPWLVALVACGGLIAASGAVVLYRMQGASLTTAGLALLTLMFALGLAESLTTRIVLHPDTLVVVRNFRRHRIERTNIERAVQERGTAIALELKGGGWFELPSLAREPHINTLRAWLKNGTA